MKRRNIIIMIATLIALLVIIAIATYAALTPDIIANNLNIATNLSDGYIFNATGEASLSMSITSTNMAQANVGNFFESDNSNIMVTLQTDGIDSVCCDYDIMWEWEETDIGKNKYGLSDGATLEFALEGSLTETYYDGSSNVNVPKTNPIFTNQIPNYDNNELAKAVYKAKICNNNNTTLETQTWSLKTRFYNLNVNQDRLKGASLKGKAKVGNQSCHKHNAAEKIASLVGTTGTDGSGNAWGVVEDHGIRYVGQNPDNWIWFNCSDLSNQNATNCERWRIIGVFNEKYDTNNDGIPDTEGELIKIIRNDSLGNYSWDYKLSGVGSSTSDYGSNDWSDSQLMMMLNPSTFLNSGYVTEGGAATHSNTIDGEGYVLSDQQTPIKIYRNMGSYFDSTKTAYVPAQTTTSGFSSTAQPGATFTKMNPLSQDMIATVKWHLTGPNGTNYQSSSNGLASHWYNYERNIDNAGYVYTGAGTRPKIWYGKIGLMYPSDYGFATSGNSSVSGYDRASCLNKELYNIWNSGNYQTYCANLSWLHYNNATGGTSATKGSASHQWTIISRSDKENYVFFVRSSGDVRSDGEYYSVSVRPVLYLSTSIKITGGDGSYNSPYSLSYGEPVLYTTISGQITWNDNNDASGIRPASVNVILLQDGEEYETRQVTVATNYSYTFANVPVNDGSGHVYIYEVRMTAIPGYYTRTSEYDIIANRLTPPPDDPRTPPL